MKESLIFEMNQIVMGCALSLKYVRDANANVLLNNLYKQTALQTSFGINMLALVDGQPKVLELKEILYHYLEHQKVVIKRRTQFELNKAEASCTYFRRFTYCT